MIEHVEEDLRKLDDRERMLRLLDLKRGMQERASWTGSVRAKEKYGTSYTVVSKLVRVEIKMKSTTSPKDLSSDSAFVIL